LQNIVMPGCITVGWFYEKSVMFLGFLVIS